MSSLELLQFVINLEANVDFTHLCSISYSFYSTLYINANVCHMLFLLKTLELPNELRQ